MDSLDSSFIIEINDKPIAKTGDDEDEQVFTQTQVNTDAEVAMFTRRTADFVVAIGSSLVS
jgi:hypothetical protein